MKSGTTFAKAAASVEAAWVCAAQEDVQREEEERVEALAKLRTQSIKDKYELASAASRLDQELKEQQLQWRKKTEERRLRQLPTDERGKALTAVESSNNRKKGGVYAMENLRLAMLMRDTKLRQRMKKKKVRPRIVQDMLTLERRYAEAARRLQIWWRGHLHRQFWRLYFRQVKAAVQIQRIARGYLTRQWVRIWHVNRTIRVTRLQALFRGYYIRAIVLPTWVRWEYFNAAKIQSIVRMHFAIKVCWRHRREVAALHIQTIWRGFSSRKRSDLRWLEVRAINLQSLIRGTLARKKTRRRRVRLESSAVKIQRMFRGMQARTKICALLRDRETANRHEFMAVLEAEEEWHRAQRDKLQARLNRKQLQQRVAQLEYDYFTQHEQIHDMESIYLDMQTQRMRVSPRAIEQGWVEEMEVKLKQQRALITKLKIDTVFKLGLEFKRREKELVEFQQRIYAVEEKRRRFEAWRDEEFLDYWERECRFRYQEKRVERRQQIAETRRRLQIQFYRTNGKRDNRWRGTHWTQDVLEAAKEKEVFCIGSTDILALVHDKWHNRMQSIGSSRQVVDDEEKERDTREHIRDLTDQVALTAATSQTEITTALFDTVLRQVERSFDKVQQQQRGHDRRLLKTRQEKETQEGTIIDEDHKPEVQLKIAWDPLHEVDRQQRKRQLLLAAKVPWHLLDQLEAQRRKLKHEKAMFKLWGRTSAGE